MKKILRLLWLELMLKLRVLFAAATPWAGDITPVGRLSLRVIRANGAVEDVGLVSTKVVTTAGVNYLVDCLQGTVEPEVLKFHGSGTGTTAEASSQTALVTEVVTRATGSLGEGASANIFRTVGTITYDNTYAITEHAVFSASSAGTMLDRSLFAAINVAANDAIEFTYDLTLPAGS